MRSRCQSRRASRRSEPGVVASVAASTRAPHRFEQRGHALRRSRRRCGRTAAPSAAAFACSCARRAGSSSASILLAATSCGRSQQLRAEQLELAADDVEVVGRLAARRRRHVHQVHQHLRALEVAQELVAEPVARCAPSIRPGHVGDDEAPVVAQADHAEVRRQRRERVVGNLRAWRPRCARSAWTCRRWGSRRGRRRPAASAAGAATSVRPASPAWHAGARGWWRSRIARCRARRRRPWRRARAGLLGQVGDQLGTPPSPPVLKTTVPTGTCSSRSAPSLPCRLEPWPCPPRRP